MQISSRKKIYLSFIGSWQRMSKDDGVFHSKSVLCKEYRRVLFVFISPKAFTAL